MKDSIWTRGFSILSAGSFISYVGHACIYFMLALLLLDTTGSVLVFSIYLLINNLVKIIVPLISGPYMDRFSRKKAIYSLDFISAAMYLCCWFIYSQGTFEYWMVYVLTILIAIIESIYKVAFTSLFPIMVKEQNMSKAYSIFSGIDMLSRTLSPIAAIIYKKIGASPVFLMCAIIFAIAAIVELFIEVDEKYICDSKTTSFRLYVNDLQDGFKLISNNYIFKQFIIFELLVSLVIGVRGTLILPFCNSKYKYGYLIYMLILGSNFNGQLIASGLLYKLKIPQEKLHIVLNVALIAGSLLSGSVLFVHIILIVIIEFYAGICEVSSSNIRNSSVQKHLDDNVKGRYNGILTMSTSLGLIIGELLCGLLSKVMSLPAINAFLCFAVAAVQVVLIIKGRKQLKDFFKL